MYFYCHKRRDMLVRKFRLCPAHPTMIGPPACKSGALIVNGLKYIQLKFRIKNVIRRWPMKAHMFGHGLGFMPALNPVLSFSPSPYAKGRGCA